jgi:hypothetical protein
LYNGTKEKASALFWVMLYEISPFDYHHPELTNLEKPALQTNIEITIIGIELQLVVEC